MYATTSRRWIHLIIVAGALGPTSIGLAQSPAQNLRGSMQVDGRERTYLAHVPPSYGGDRAVPLVLVLHGRLGDGRGTAELTQFDRVSDKHGFLVVYPDGLERSWADGRGGTPSDEKGVDDVAFLSALIRKLAHEYKVDTARVYATGISNGGFMSQRLACGLSEQIAAVGVVAATMGKNVASRCAPKLPVSVLVLIGTKDPLVPIEGGVMRRGAGGAILSLDETAREWASLDGCKSKPEVTVEPDWAGDGTRIRRDTYSACKEGTEVLIYWIEGGGHTWPGGKQYLPELMIGKTTRNLDASEVIWKFFERHTQP